MANRPTTRSLSAKIAETHYDSEAEGSDQKSSDEEDSDYEPESEPESEPEPEPEPERESLSWLQAHARTVVFLLALCLTAVMGFNAYMYFTITSDLRRLRDNSLQSATVMKQLEQTRMHEIDSLNSTFANALVLTDPAQSTDEQVVAYMVHEYLQSAFSTDSDSDSVLSAALLNSTIRAVFAAARCEESVLLLRRLGDNGRADVPLLCNPRMLCAMLHNYMTNGTQHMSNDEKAEIMRGSFAYLVHDAISEENADVYSKLRVMLAEARDGTGATSAMQHVVMSLVEPMHKSLLKWMYNATEGVQMFREMTKQKARAGASVLSATVYNASASVQNVIVDWTNSVQVKVNELVTLVLWWVKAGCLVVGVCVIIIVVNMTPAPVRMAFVACAEEICNLLNVLRLAAIGQYKTDSVDRVARGASTRTRKAR